MFLPIRQEHHERRGMQTELLNLPTFEHLPAGKTKGTVRYESDQKEESKKLYCEERHCDLLENAMIFSYSYLSQ